MSKWYLFLVLLGVSVGIFVLAPMGLVGHFIANFTPAGLEWVGTAFAIGLSLSIVSNSFLTRWKTMRSALYSLIVLTVSEAAMSGATLYLQALEAGRMDVVVGIGILAIVAMQEAVLISGGLGLSLVLNKIGEESDRRAARLARQAERLHAKADRQAAIGKTPDATGAPEAMPRVPAGRRGTYEEFLAMQVARNGGDPVKATEVARELNVPLRTAYHWLERYHQQHRAPSPLHQEEH